MTEQVCGMSIIQLLERGKEQLNKDLSVDGNKGCPDRINFAIKILDEIIKDEKLDKSKIIPLLKKSQNLPSLAITNEENKYLQEIKSEIEEFENNKKLKQQQNKQNSKNRDNGIGGRG